MLWCSTPRPGRTRWPRPASSPTPSAVTGVVLTKLDGTAKGGVVVAVQRELGLPVKLVGLGEGPDDLVPFDPEHVRRRPARLSSSRASSATGPVAWPSRCSTHSPTGSSASPGACAAAAGSTDADLDEALREIRTALLEADVELGVVRGFIDAVRERCAGEALSKSLTPGQQVIKAVHEELVRGPRRRDPQAHLRLAAARPSCCWPACRARARRPPRPSSPSWWKQQGRNPLLVGADLQRPAAVEQLRVLGGQAGVTVFSEPTDPVDVADAGVEEARRLGRDVCIIDTAGRLAIDEELMDEVRRISEATEPHYTFLVIDAMTGQDAVATAQRLPRDARRSTGSS